MLKAGNIIKHGNFYYYLIHSERYDGFVEVVTNLFSPGSIYGEFVHAERCVVVTDIFYPFWKGRHDP